MILAAGLGTRLRPLSELCAKPAMPVMGLPLVGYLPRLLQRHGVTEVLLNLHHLPETIERAVERFGRAGRPGSGGHHLRPDPGRGALGGAF